jgi:PAS domain S-box-containing protein
MRGGALRYALVLACVLVAVLLQLSPVGSLFPGAGLFAFAVLVAAWFGGPGPGLLTAALGALTLPQLVTVSYPLFGGFLDLPRFAVFSVMGVAVGWGCSRRAGKLREQERYARAMEASDDGFWDWIPATDTMYTSPRLLEIYGIEHSTSFAGRNDLLAQIPFHPEDRPLLMQSFAEHFAGKTARYDVEARIIRHGEERWVHLTGMAARDPSGAVVRWTGTVRDVTERKRVQEALRESEQRYELAMAASESGYWDWDVLTDRFFVSSRANELVGFPSETTFTTRANFRGRIPVHPDDWEKWEAAREEVFAGKGERLAMELRYIVRGETRWFALQAICKRDNTGKVVRWTGSSTDVTERKLAEEALQTLERKLRQAQRLEAMGTFAGGIAHDFNNILGAILGFGEMAQRGARKGSRLARDLDSIMIAGERGRALVSRLLTFSRSVVGERETVYVERVVREVLDLVSAQLPPCVNLHAQLHAGRAAILGDATQVHQVLTNLANNALQAMPAGGTLRVELAKVGVDVARAAMIGELAVGEYIVLTVADTGAGIAPDIMEHIFDPFFTTKEVGTGTGLGLSLVHGIVTELGGGIDLITEVGVGTTFTVYLPRSGEAAEAEDDAELALPRGDGQRVLVVDDEEPLVHLATRTLEELGYAPVGFTSSSAALAALRAEPQRFDALITDERMPGMSGSALIREVRGIHSSMPVVLMSGHLGPTADKKIAAAIRADEVLQKPLSARDLATSLARVLRL